MRGQGQKRLRVPTIRHPCCRPSPPKLTRPQFSASTMQQEHTAPFYNNRVDLTTDGPPDENVLTIDSFPHQVIDTSASLAAPQLLTSSGSAHHRTILQPASIQLQAPRCSSAPLPPLQRPHKHDYLEGYPQHSVVQPPFSVPVSSPPNPHSCPTGVHNTHRHQPYRNMTMDQHLTRGDEEEDDEAYCDDDFHAQHSYQNVLENHSAQISGQGMGHLEPYIEPISTPLSFQIPLSIQKQIWSNQYIDFALLLPSDPILVNQAPKFQLQLDSQANISVVPSTKAKRISSLESWNIAFHRFVSIYANKHPFETSALMKYAEIVGDLARKYGSTFIVYDRQFRQLRQSTPHPWDRIHMEFYLMASTQPITAPVSHNNRPFRSGSSFSQGKRSSKFLAQTCWAFNKNSVCTLPNCRHPHICGYCKGPHSAAQCPKSKSSTSQRPAITYTNANRSTQRKQNSS